MNQKLTQAIQAEREKQIAKGFDAAHDDEHWQGEMAMAAVLYAVPPEKRHYANGFYPWEPLPTLKSDTQENLVVAMALLEAEWERIERLRS